MLVRAGLTFAAALAAAVLFAVPGSAGAATGTRDSSGPCSQPTAQQLELDRVASVLCGAFLGPGSQAMVVQLTGGTCLPFLGWQVFVLREGAWRPVPLAPHGGPSGHPVTAVGSDIRETDDARRASDALCNPTGGTRARIWHWNGSRFVASPWKQLTPPKPKPKRARIVQFLTPSHNVTCEIGPFGDSLEHAAGQSTRVQANCISMTPDHAVQLFHDGTLHVCNSGCGSSLRTFDSGPVLAYGEHLDSNGFRCTSRRTGLVCTVTLSGKGSGKGFQIGRTGVERLGP